MADLTVSFSYTVGNARFDTETDVDQEAWDEMSHQERIDTLSDAAKDDVESYLEIVEDTINDEGE